MYNQKMNIHCTDDLGNKFTLEFETRDNGDAVDLVYQDMAVRTLRYMEDGWYLDVNDTWYAYYETAMDDALESFLNWFFFGKK